MRHFGYHAIILFMCVDNDTGKRVNMMHTTNAT
jgi:hypothetical protein